MGKERRDLEAEERNRGRGCYVHLGKKKKKRACQKLDFSTKIDRKEVVHMVKKGEANTAKEPIMACSTYHQLNFASNHR